MIQNFIVRPRQHSLPQTKKMTAQRSCAIYAPVDSTVIRQFSKSFSKPFRSCLLHLSTVVYKGQDIE